MISGYALTLFGIGLPGALILSGAVTAAAVELLPVPVNDNLLIPLLSGGAMQLIARFLE
jgi:dolichol kinase